MSQVPTLKVRILVLERERDALSGQLRDTQDALHVMMTAAKRDPDAAFEWPDRNDRVGLVLAKAVERANMELES